MNPIILSIQLPQEVWDRILDILNYSGHPDASYCHTSLTNQLNLNCNKEKNQNE